MKQPLQTRNPSTTQKCPVTLHIDAGTRCAQKASLSSAIALNPPEHLFFFLSLFLIGPAQPQSRAERTGGRAEPSGADNWIGVEAQLPAAAAAAAASSGKLPAPPPPSLAHNHRTHTEPLIGRDRCRRCFRNHTMEASERCRDGVREKRKSEATTSSHGSIQMAHGARCHLYLRVDPLKAPT